MYFHVFEKSLIFPGLRTFNGGHYIAKHGWKRVYLAIVLSGLFFATVSW
jgi:hypothetical protein